MLDLAGSVRGLAIVGTIGAGKTTVAEALSTLLHEKAIRHGLIDVDWLGQLYPPPDEQNPFSLELGFTNLSLIAPNFLDLGARHLVIAVTLTSRSELAALRAAIPHVELSICLLGSSARTRRDRIESRDVGRLREDFLRRTDELDAQIRSESFHDLEVVNDARSPSETAAEILSLLDWERSG